MVIADESVKRHAIVMSMARQIRSSSRWCCFFFLSFSGRLFFLHHAFNMETRRSLSFSQGIDTHTGLDLLSKVEENPMLSSETLLSHMRDITAYSHEVASFCSVSVNEWLWLMPCSWIIIHLGSGHCLGINSFCLVQLNGILVRAGKSGQMVI